MYPQLTSSIVVARWLRASSWLESQGTQNQTQSGPSLFLPYPVTFGTVPNPETDRLTPARGKTIRRYHLMGKECDPQTGLITGTRLLSWYWAPCNRFSGPRFESRTGPYTFVIMLMHGFFQLWLRLVLAVYLYGEFIMSPQIKQSSWAKSHLILHEHWAFP